MSNTFQTIRSAISTAAKSSGLRTIIESDVSAEQPTDGGNSDITLQLSLAGIIEQARTSTRVLEQYLIDATVKAPQTKSEQRYRDSAHETTEAVRDAILAVAGDGFRVERILSPNPFSPPDALRGQYVSKFQIDLDVLRSLATVEPPAITDTGNNQPILTKARAAVWDAIDNWQPFAASGDVPAAWVRKFNAPADVEELSLHDPGPADLPAIAVTWGPVSANWWVNTMQQWGQQLFVTFWLPASWEQVAEWRLMQLQQAIYQSAPVESPTVSYVRRAVGRPPTKNSPVSLELVALGRTQSLHAWRGTIALTLTANFDPNA